MIKLVTGKKMEHFLKLKGELLSLGAAITGADPKNPRYEADMKRFRVARLDYYIEMQEKLKLIDIDLDTFRAELRWSGITPQNFRENNVPNLREINNRYLAILEKHNSKILGEVFTSYDDEKGLFFSTTPEFEGYRLGGKPGGRFKFHINAIGND